MNFSNNTILVTAKSSKKISEKKIAEKNNNELVSSLPAELQVTPENQSAILATCDEVGLTRKRCITALNEALEATKMTIDKYGEEHIEPDHDKRIKASLAGLELRGDFKNKDAVKPMQFNTVIYQWKS